MTWFGTMHVNVLHTPQHYDNWLWCYHNTNCFKIVQWGHVCNKAIACNIFDYLKVLKVAIPLLDLCNHIMPMLHFHFELIKLLLARAIWLQLKGKKVLESSHVLLCFWSHSQCVAFHHKSFYTCLCTKYFQNSCLFKPLLINACGWDH